jgi:hypothetical protein
MIVTVHFGDGTFKLIEVVSDDPQKAVQEAKTFVLDNAWFEVEDESGQVLATENI